MGSRLGNATSLYIEAIRDGDYVQAINAYSGDRYTQHSTPVRDGREGFIEFFADFVRRNPVRDIEIVRSFVDGRYVFLHVLQNLNDGEFRYVTADIFDTDDEGRLIEHWDIIEEMYDTAAGERTQLDGPTEPDDGADSEASKALVRRYVEAALVAGDLDRIAEFVADDCAQHRPGIGDGSAALRSFAQQREMRYIELHLVVGAGDMVATLAERELDGTRQAVIDLYRVVDGSIAEHWDVVEDITPQATWVNSGKF